MKVTHCLDVCLRFNKPGLQGVMIATTNGPLATRYLRIENDSITLSIKFCDKNGNAGKEINYNFRDVTEYDCSGWVDPELVKERG